MAEYKLPYTGAEINAKLNQIDNLAKAIADKVSTAPQTLTEAQKAQARANVGAATTEQVSQLSKAIEDLGGNVIPDYIVAEAEKVASAVQATRTAKSLVFPVMTDMHLYSGNSLHDASLLSAQYAGMGVKKLRELIHLDFAGYLGDYSWMSSADNYTAEQVMADITAFKKITDTTGKEIWCVGNHDLNGGETRDRMLTLDELYSYIGANSDGVKPYTNIERGYGYADFDNQKIRVIYLNTCDTSDWTVTEGSEAAASWISPTQIQWICDTALDFTDKATPSDWGIVVVGHHPLHYPQGCFGYVMTILEAYRDGLSGALSCTVRVDTAEDGTSTYPQQKVTYDFSASERAEIICNIHGHNHNFGYSQISSTTWKENSDSENQLTPWLWRFCIPNLCNGRENSGYESFSYSEILKKNYGEIDESGNPVYWRKETGTAKATSFCVVSIDRSNKKIYAYVFGAGKDRVVSYDVDYVPAEYDITVSLSNCTASSGNVSTITENGTAALTFTAADGYELPDSVTVTGASYTWDKASGTLVLSIPTADVSVSITAVEGADEPSYTNLLDAASYETNVKISSSGGAITTASGYNTSGYMQISGYGSSNTARGELVLYLANIEGLSTDSNVRIAFYDSEKEYIGIHAATKMVTADSTESAKTVYTVDSNGYINSLDISGVTGYYHNSPSYNDVAWVRFCAPGLDGDSIITFNEPIE